MTELLRKFVRESNRIEGILLDPHQHEVDASVKFLDLEVIGIDDLRKFVDICQHGAALRNRSGMDVFVGNHRPPPGGSEIQDQLIQILGQVANGAHPFDIHHAYETLHPFMDGNGRSGRILWAWQMLSEDIWPRLQLGFLHTWYYQSLERQRR